MDRSSRLDKFVDKLTEVLHSEKYREFALKKLLSLNLTTETYQRHEVGGCASVLIEMDLCTEICKQLLRKIEMVAKKESAGRKRAREQSSSSDEEEEPVCKKERSVPQEEEHLKVPQEEEQLEEKEHLEEEEQLEEEVQPEEEEQLEEDRQIQQEVREVIRRSKRQRVPKKIWENP